MVEQEPGRDRETRWEERLALPVIIAALASVPAVFLTLLDDPYETVGSVVNVLSGAVLVAETAVLFAVSTDKREWIRRHRWLLLLTVAILVGVVLAVGPVQLLRLLRVFGALRLIRAGRIVKAAGIMRERMGLTGVWSKVAYAATALLVAVFVGVILADPTSQSRQLVDRWLGGGATAILGVLAGVILAVATFVVVRRRQQDRSD